MTQNLCARSHRGYIHKWLKMGQLRKGSASVAHLKLEAGAARAVDRLSLRASFSAVALVGETQ